MLQAPEFRRLLFSTVGAFANVALLQGTVPLWAASAGAGGLGAGSTWGVMMAATVLTQLSAPGLLTRYGHQRVLLASTILLAGSAPLTALSAGLGPLWALAAVRGAGFGLLTVAGSASVVLLVPPRQRGRGLGMYGVAIGLANLICLPGGVWVANQAGFAVVFVAAGVLAGLAVGFSPRRRTGGARRLGGRAAEGRHGTPGSGSVTGGRVAAGGTPGTAGREAGPERSDRWSLLRGLALPWTVMTGSAIVGGAVATFVPLAADPATTPSPGWVAPLALFGFGGAALLARWAAGELGDRFGHGRALPPAAAATGVGTLACGIALALGTTGMAVALLTAGAVVAGAGFGTIQNDTLVVMFERAGRSGRDTTSAAWNIAFDFGTGFGATGLGLLADHLGEASVFTAAAVVMLACLPAALLERTRAARTRAAQSRIGRNRGTHTPGPGGAGEGSAVL